MPAEFLPASRQEMKQLGWDHVDVVLVTGDAYVDHPAFGVALIGRLLEAQGLRVAILSQPRHHDAADFTTFGQPRLFFGITGGNLDSIVANYTGNGRVRDEDAYSPGGNPYFGEEKSRQNRRRPDRATITYANLARAAYRQVPIVLGGLEASLRRFVHYDYQQEKLRSSVLTDAKADLLVYGMGEKAVLEIAARLQAGCDLTNIPGTCERLTDQELHDRLAEQSHLALPSWQEINQRPELFMAAEKSLDKHARALSELPVVQRQQALWVLQQRPAPPLTPEELDRLYELPFSRKPHPGDGELPAFRMIRDSVTIVRGCSGNCSFCAISRHQGPVVTSRSPASILTEVKNVAGQPGFTGTISDLGGPTANLYGTSCANPAPCTIHDCLFPKICRHLRIDEERFLDLLQKAAAIPGVRHLFVSSGLRMELLLRTPKLLAAILAHHTPGALKIAPEHTDPEVLRLMHKPGPEVLQEFLTRCRALNPKVSLSSYFISAHPGCTEKAMQGLAAELVRLKLPVRQFQDFTPTPGTLATAMYVTGLDRDRARPIQVAKSRTARQAQRQVLERLRPTAPDKKGRSRPRPRPAKAKKRN